jgi:hypothetical protein
MKLIELSIVYDLVVCLFFCTWLWVLIYRRDLWLRCTAKESAFYSRLHFPSRFVTAIRRFSEGRFPIYFAAVGLLLSVLLLVASVSMYFYFKDRLQHHHQPNKSLQATAAAPSVLDGVGDSLLPGLVVAAFPAPVPELLTLGHFVL